MIVRLAPLLFAALTACGPQVDLSGDWTGEMTCGEGSPTLAWRAELVADADGESFSGPAELGVTTTEGEEDFNFTLVFSAADGGGEGDLVPLELDVQDCTITSTGEVNCWSGAADWDSGDDELLGTFSGMYLNDGECDWTLEKML
ncbi:MAG: hypothetical protein IPN01_19085 [Deltaproteobacteria bacterium]|nr:hypothetical protein [Deltaproteobacteria bacterium]